MKKAEDPPSPINFSHLGTVDSLIHNFKKNIRAKIDAIRPRLHKAVDQALQEVEETILQSSQVSEVEYIHRRQSTHDFSQLSKSLSEFSEIPKMRTNSVSVGKSYLESPQLPSKEVRVDEVLLQERLAQDVQIMIDEDQVFEAIRGAVHVHGAEHEKYRKKREEALFEHSGLFDLKTGRYAPFRRPLKLPSSSALLQTNRTLYVCGGESGESNLVSLAGLISLDYQGQCSELSSMKRARKSLSLAQAHGIMLALGGWDKTTLNNVEKYFISLNKWGWMPSLKTGRQWPASCMLPQTLTTYCFCGFNKKKEVLNTVEKIDPQGVRQWSQISLDSRIEPIFCAAACVIQNSILLFGGHTTQYMFELSHNLELQADHSHIPLIPGDTGVFAHLVQDGVLYAIGQRKDQKYVRYLRYYNGIMWRRLAR